jgi:flagellar biosynthetic protein FliR
MQPLIIPLKPLLIFIVVLARTGGLVTFAPFWGHQALTAQVRVVLAMVMALAITPMLVNRLPEPPSSMLALAPILIVELLIGCAFGFVGRLVFNSLEIAAQLIGFQMGFSLAGTIDPNSHAQTTALNVLAQMLGLVIFMSADCHHWLLLTTVRSFEVVGPGGAHVTAGLAQLFIRLSADALAVGIALAAPAIVMLLAVEIALAIAGRAIPQIQVMILGFPVKIAAGLWLLGASLYFIPNALRGTLGAMQHGLSRALTLL